MMEIGWKFQTRVNRASATKTVASGSISSRVQPKTIKIGIHTSQQLPG